MAGFADFVDGAQPARYHFNKKVTEGMTWRFVIDDLRDKSGALIDFTSITCTCTVYTQDRQVVTTLVCAGANGKITLSKDETLTGGLANGLTERRCMWALVATNATDTAEVFSAVDSQLYIRAA